MGNIKSRLMLMDEELVSAGLAATNAHLDINLRLPNMNTLDTRFRTAFLDGPSKVNQSYWHHW